MSRSTRGSSKEAGKLIRQAEQQGWAHSRTSKSHHKLTSPGGASVIMSSTPRHPEECIKKTRCLLRKHGFVG